jgi:hypothetical protein
MTASAAASADRDDALVARRTIPGAAAAAGVTWTSGLEPAGSGLTSLISRPVTSGPAGAAGGTRRVVGRLCRGRGRTTARRAATWLTGLGGEVVVVALVVMALVVMVLVVMVLVVIAAG